ncbi:P antigen family member 3-like [Eptesicus fuscus]|uniref:P antigen family member 3-like n=1 Tax=Eptesicus fuscus TaxID=29078 RepID=UPI00240463C7|nr:P antigen family member 3-like [Eptesicus fuscus]
MAPSDEQPQKEEPPTESQDVTPDEEKADAGAPEEMTQPKTDGEDGDELEVKGEMGKVLEVSAFVLSGIMAAMALEVLV